MHIDLDTVLQAAIVAGMALVGFLLKRTFVDKIDALETKIDALVDTVAEMKESNSKDHAEVVRKIAHIEGKLGI